uniref:Uncharacterized protein n=1 Tax=Magallana gigas TaxID=29159 RepID=A0A8W8N2M3_MAGGI
MRVKKELKYQNLVDNIRSKGWIVCVFPVEIGCRGFPAQSMWRSMSVLGIKGKERKAEIQTVNIMLVMVEKSSTELEAIYRRAGFWLIIAD